MNKKGYTLVEVIAVLVILALLFIVTTPVVDRLIKKSKLSSAQSSAESFARAVDQFIVNENDDPDKDSKLSANIFSLIDIKDKDIKSGFVYMIDSSHYSMKLVVGDYCFVKKSDETNAEIMHTEDLSICAS